MDYDKYLRWKSIVMNESQPSEDSSPNKTTSGESFLSDSGEDNKQVTISNKLKDDDIIQTIPKNYRQKAKQILFQLARISDKFKWNSKGEISVDNNPAILGSNIIDIVKDMITSYKDFEPVGSQELYELLAQTNFPLTLIGNLTRRRQAGGNLERVNKSSVPKENTNTFPPGVLVNEPTTRRFVYKSDKKTTIKQKNKTDKKKPIKKLLNKTSLKQKNKISWIKFK